MLKVRKVKNRCNLYFPGIGLLHRTWLVLGPAAVAILSMSCGRLPAAMSVPPTIWLMPLHEATEPASIEPPANGFIVLDSVSFRPIPGIAAGIPGPGSRSPTRDSTPASPSGRVAGVTTFQGARYHPETVRALAADSLALGATAGAVAAMASSMAADGLIIDFQGMNPVDIRGLIGVSRALADSARKYVLGPIGFVVPAADTAGYPGALISRTANLVVVRLDGEHRPGTAPGAFASAQWLVRHLGARAAEVGASRIVAELPLSGYRWARDGTAMRTTWEQARAAVLSDGTAFSRDPTSRALKAASSRDGWEIWINDHETIEFLISAARRIGVNRFVIAGAEGADPEAWARIRAISAGSLRD